MKIDTPTESAARAGINGQEIARLRRAVFGVTVSPLIAAFDGETLQVPPDDASA